MQLNSSTVALVTGGASGLGGATARRLRRRRRHGRHHRPPGLHGSGRVDERNAAARGQRRSSRPTCATSPRCRPPIDRRHARSASCAWRSTAPASATPGRIIGRGGPLALDTFQHGHRHQPRRHVQRAAPRRGGDARQRARRRRPRRHRQHRVASRPSTGRSARRRTPRRKGGDRRPDPAGRARPRGQGDPRHDHRARHLRDADARRPARRGQGASSRSRCRTRRGSADPRSTRRWCAHIVDNPMLNGEVIRLDGALRMPPR